MSKFLRSFVFVTIAFSFLLAACGTSATPAATNGSGQYPGARGNRRDAGIHCYAYTACSRLCYAQWLGKQFPSAR